MTLSPNRGGEPTVAKVIKQAMRKAGQFNFEQGENSSHWTAMANDAKEKLEAIVDELQTYNVYARAMVLQEIALIVDQQDYAADASAMKVLPKMTVRNSSGLESGVRIVSLYDWQTLTPLAATGTPTHAFVDESTVPFTVSVWPVPTTTDTLVLRVQKAMADADGLNYTLDLEPWWQRYLFLKLAYDLAEDYQAEPGKIRRLYEEARESLMRCRGKAARNVAIRPRVGLPSRGCQDG